MDNISLNNLPDGKKAIVDFKDYKLKRLHNV